MGLLLRFIIGIAVLALGLFCLVKTRKVVHQIGYNDWAEAHFGGGGTYMLVKSIGILIMVLAVLFVLGILKIF